MEKGRIKGIAYYVFDNIKEFTEHFESQGKQPPHVIKDWREGKQDEWVYSDDKRIVQLLKVAHSVKHHGDRKNYKFAKGWVRTIVGTFLNRENTFMDTDFSSHANRYTFSKTIKNPSSRVKKRTKPTNKEKEFATNVVVGMGAVKAYMTAFSEENKDNGLDEILKNKFVQELLKFVSDIRTALGDEKGDLENSEIVQRAKDAYKG